MAYSILDFHSHARTRMGPQMAGSGPSGVREFNSGPFVDSKQRVHQMFASKHLLSSILYRTFYIETLKFQCHSPIR